MIRLNLLRNPWFKDWDARLPYPKTVLCAHCEHVIYGIGCDNWDGAHGESLLPEFEDPPPPLFVDDDVVFCWEGCRRAYEDASDGPSRIYFIRQGHEGPIKIGIARNVKSRRDDLQTGSAERLIILGTMSGDRRVERTLHEMFAEDRLRGEWFKPSEDLIHLVIAMTDGEGFEEGDEEDRAA